MSESRSRKRSKGELNISSSTMSGHIIPNLDNGYDIGSASYKILK